MGPQPHAARHRRNVGSRLQRLRHDPPLLRRAPLPPRRQHGEGALRPMFRHRHRPISKLINQPSHQPDPPLPNKAAFTGWVQHRASLPWQDVPEFVASLRAQIARQQPITALAFEFLILRRATPFPTVITSRDCLAAPTSARMERSRPQPLSRELMKPTCQSTVLNRWDFLIVMPK
jgi:hypothetical protein